MHVLKTNRLIHYFINFSNKDEQQLASKNYTMPKQFDMVLHMLLTACLRGYLSKLCLKWEDK